MQDNMEICIEAKNSEQLQAALTAITPIGRVVDRWSATSVNFRCDREEDLDEAIEKLDELGIEYNLV
jgi:hypothetical protein